MCEERDRNLQICRRCRTRRGMPGDTRRRNDGASYAIRHVHVGYQPLIYVRSLPLTEVAPPPSFPAPPALTSSDGGGDGRQLLADTTPRLFPLFVVMSAGLCFPSCSRQQLQRSSSSAADRCFQARLSHVSCCHHTVYVGWNPAQRRRSPRTSCHTEPPGYCLL